MRSHEEINEASLRIVGTYACLMPKGRYTCAYATKDQCIEYNSEFAALSPDDQDCILYHEAGHVVALRDEGSVNTKMYGRKECPYRYSKLYYAAECEADLYAARQVGLNRLLQLYHSERLFDKRNKTERRKRIRNLLKAWESK
jgi:hypothetical protein